MSLGDETGPEFEIRALNIARAIHDPNHLQGAIIYKGRERDALFVNDDSINAYEFTILRTKDKAKTDARKLREMLEDLQKKPENAYKSLTGWFVTRDEPTPDQRAAVAGEIKGSNAVIYAISFAALRRRVCDSESYLNARDEAPFGSIVYSTQALPQITVDTLFTTQNEKDLNIEELGNELVEGARWLLTGEFGVGKSHALRQIYFALRKMHFKRKMATPFPVHINLRDCVGLRSPSEILRRHAEEIGLGSDRSLISAWRAGACILLLDGFDEIVPSRWLGSASDLKSVRWQALAPVRRLIQETPVSTGIIACGRSHYFSSPSEMVQSLGFASTSCIISLQDFNKNQIEQYLALAGVDWEVPEWLPARPLLIGYLVAMESVSEIDSITQTTQAEAWRKLFVAICEREARIVTAVRPETIMQLVSRVATLARSRGDETGPVDMEIMRSAFVEVNGRDPDEEGMELLLRLPGLAVGDYAGQQEQRVFVDRDLADTAYGEDLAKYLISPYEGHPLGRTASWVSSASDLGIGVAAGSLLDQNISVSSVLAAAGRRQDNHQFDAVLADTLRTCSELDPEESKVRKNFLVEGVMFSLLALSNNDPVLSRTTFKDCLIEVLDISAAEEVGKYPTFDSCIIGYLDGASAIPEWLTTNFMQCAVEEFSSKSQTTAGIMELKLSPERRVALTILKKIYNQPGSARKEEALSRGLNLRSRELVSDVIDKLVSQGWIIRITSRGRTLYAAAKDKRGQALKMLESPTTFWSSE
ncbi:hypothetical protein GCM10022226_53620 [Sphaerisporangium flaviroseum]|uniref:NACHT domain-containing protein n=1 Tax=Sphaerisporangium flaviroseum TaxID=509199 RepID=A0ABP7ITX7_9ACTN